MLVHKNVDKQSGIVRVAKVTAGFTLLPVGMALLVLPGPGLPVLAAGLMLLGDEYAWAAKARDGMTSITKRSVTWLQQRAFR
jgi:hypothetical protein